MSRWWKCDLQVATPAWRFELPRNESFDLSTNKGREAFAKRYMETLRAKGIEVIALADHNTGAWIDLMVKAGEEAGVAVFPGCEVTTGSGSDGIHIIVIGKRDKSSQDFDRLLSGPLGFAEPAHPRFHEVGGQRQPGSSGRTILQILEALPDGYLVLAPHALNDNGIAARNTARGDIRWKALHHERIVALDPGDCSDVSGDGFNARFRRRELDDFPCLGTAAFVSMSDAYSLDSLGARFCWIRMVNPSLEGLRQAFLDREARVICDWDPRLNDYPDRDPNRVRHAWVKEVRLCSIFDNSTSSLGVPFHPALNVIIGGRGSGKSTVVAALRQLYSSFTTLPDPVKDEAEKFAHDAFDGGVLSSTHHVANSQDQQTVSWGSADGIGRRGNVESGIPTTFRVRVVNQKELFSRVSYDPSDQFSASRSFLSFVDEGLGILPMGPSLPGEWRRGLDDAASEWSEAARKHDTLKQDLTRLPAIRAAIEEMKAQVAALDSPEAKARREVNEQRFRERDVVAAARSEIVSLASKLREQVQAGWIGEQPALVGLSDEAIVQFNVGRAIGRELATAVGAALSKAEETLSTWDAERERSEWLVSVKEAEIDEQKYVEELQGLGIDPNAYIELKEELSRQVALEGALAARQSELQAAEEDANRKWNTVVAVIERRRQRRQGLLNEVAARSSRLRFSVHPFQDVSGWVRAVRELLNLRSDGFREDVVEVAKWLWLAADPDTREARWKLWRHALVSGDFSTVASRSEATMRQTWQRRLESLDQALRLRLAVEIADDAVEMRFLRDGGNADETADWQDIMRGSPGQRTAAMLAFVLHHGTEPLVLDQPEDDLDTEWLSHLVVKELRASRWRRQVIVVTHNANIPVNGDAEQIVVLENADGVLRIRETPANGGGGSPTPHVGAVEVVEVREDIQNIMEGGVPAFVLRERRYNNEVSAARWSR